MRLISSLIGLALLVGAARAAQACAICGCGDPTLTVMGAEQPFGGRLRLSSELRYRSDQIGSSADGTRFGEVRLDSAVAWAPTRDWMLSATVPLLARDVDQDALHQRTLTLGDLELTARRVVYRDRWFAPRHMVSLIAGLKLPTSPVERDATGQPLDVDAQPGTGSFDPLVGVAYAYFDHPRSAYASALVRLPSQGRSGVSVPASLRATLSVQRQMEMSFAFRLAVDARLDGTAHDNGVADEDSGGFIAFLSPGLLGEPHDGPRPRVHHPHPGRERPPWRAARGPSPVRGARL